MNQTQRNYETKQSRTNSNVPFVSGRSRISSKGKRLLALLIDFIIALLSVNTLQQLCREEHWDLFIQARQWEQLVFFYIGILSLLIIRDLGGSSPGRIMLGMTLRNLENFEEKPSIWIRVKRNFMLLLFPIEGIVLLRDPYAFRFSDRWMRTVILDHHQPMRMPMRFLFGNLIFFGFFGIAIMLQKISLEKTSAYQTAEKSMRNHIELTQLLNRFPEMDESEMSLDLRDLSNPSIVRVVVGKNDERVRATVLLELETDPRRWKVSEIRIEPLVN